METAGAHKKRTKVKKEINICNANLRKGLDYVAKAIFKKDHVVKPSKKQTQINDDKRCPHCKKSYKIKGKLESIESKVKNR